MARRDGFINVNDMYNDMAEPPAVGKSKSHVKNFCPKGNIMSHD
jgi:hypothetical protein